MPWVHRGTDRRGWFAGPYRRLFGSDIDRLRGVTVAADGDASGRRPHGGPIEISCAVDAQQGYLREDYLSPEHSEVAVLVAFADATRRRLLEILVGVGRASATGLADHLPISRQAVVKHLHILESAGLVAGFRSGREVLYVARPGPLNASARWLVELSAAWHRRLAAPVRARPEDRSRREPS